MMSLVEVTPGVVRKTNEVPGLAVLPPARILVVDDDRHNRQLLAIMLRPEGLEVVMASSGKEALALVAARPPDLILLDIMMPGMDGYQVVSAIKGNAATTNIPIIMVTAVGDRNSRLMSLSAGAEDFVTKPVDRAELCVRIRNLLRLKTHDDLSHRYGERLEGEVAARNAALVESERLYRSTFDAAPVGIVHTGLDGRWIRVNQRLCDLLGYSRKDLETKAVQCLVQAESTPGEAEAFRHLVAGITDRHVIDDERYLRQDGSVVRARVNVCVFRNAAGRPQHFISVIEDIGDWKEMEEQLRQAQKLEVIGQLAGGVAHDFNNILTAILGFSEVLLQELPPNGAAIGDVLEIQKAGERAAGLTRQLLAFSRKQVLEPQVLDINVIVQGMEPMLKRLILEHVSLVVSLQSQLRAVRIDPTQLEQIVINLAVNAADAMPQGGKLTIETANVTLDKDYRQHHLPVAPGEYVLLAVGDTGTGMEDAVIQHIFDPFFTTKELGRGTGLGLATVYGIVKQSGGDIGVHSETGRGTTFKIYLPQVSAPLSVSTVTPRWVDAILGGSETILLVEDDGAVRRLGRLILERAGYRVLEAENAKRAFQLASEWKDTIDLLLSDVIMPESEGPPLFLRLARTRPDLRVMYMSGYADEAVVRQGVVVVGTPFLQKPFTPQLLARAVREVLDAPRPPASSEHS